MKTEPISENRRNFLKKSLSTSVSLSVVGLIAAGHGAAQGATTVQTTVPETGTTLPTWWIDRTWSAAGSISVAGGPNDNAVEILKQAIKARHDSGPGTPDAPHTQAGGTAINPYKYVPVTGSPVGGANPTFSYNAGTGQWTLAFSAGYKYREIQREEAE